MISWTIIKKQNAKSSMVNSSYHRDSTEDKRSIFRERLHFQYSSARWVIPCDFLASFSSRQRNECLLYLCDILLQTFFQCTGIVTQSKAFKALQWFAGKKSFRFSSWLVLPSTLKKELHAEGFYMLKSRTPRFLSIIYVLVNELTSVVLKTVIIA